MPAWCFSLYCSDARVSSMRRLIAPAFRAEITVCLRVSMSEIRM